MGTITSDSNPLVKHIKALKIKKYREKHKEYVVEGIRFINEALKHHLQLETVMYSDGLETVNGGTELLSRLQKKYNTYQIPQQLMKKLSDTDNPQGILATIKMKAYSLVDICQQPRILIVVLDRIQDPGNMGAIIRTAEAAGANGIIITKGCVDLYNSKTLRATMGSLFHIPIVEAEDNEWISTLKDKGVRLVASHVYTQNSYLDIDYGEKTALIIGNEANGVDEALLEKADAIVKIPIYGSIESLNASIAAGILIYKAVEGR